MSNENRVEFEVTTYTSNERNAGTNSRCARMGSHACRKCAHSFCGKPRALSAASVCCRVGGDPTSSVGPLLQNVENESKSFPVFATCRNLRTMHAPHWAIPQKANALDSWPS
jgi:hypothetical protein